MPEPIDIAKLIKINPKVDANLLGQARKLLEELRCSGIRGPGYRLALPYGRKARIVDDAEERAVRLHHP